jgi:hypothetical protein
MATSMIFSNLKCKKKFHYKIREIARKKIPNKKSEGLFVITSCKVLRLADVTC